MNTSYLRDISAGRELIIEETRGDELLVTANDVFDKIDEKFSLEGFNQKQHFKPKTKARVYELIKDGTYNDIFSSISRDLCYLSLTQHQIKVFIKTYPEWLGKDKSRTFFLLRKSVKTSEVLLKDSLYVARVVSDVNGRSVELVRFRLPDGKYKKQKASRRSRFVCQIPEKLEVK